MAVSMSKKWLSLLLCFIVLMAAMVIADVLSAPIFRYAEIAKEGKSAEGALAQFVGQTKGYANALGGASYVIKKPAILGTWTVAVVFHPDRMHVQREYQARLPFIYFDSVVGDFPYK